MFQRTSSAAYAHMGKSKRDWQTGGPIRREYVHGTAHTTKPDMHSYIWVEWEGVNQILHISERGQSTYVFTYTRTYRLVPVLYWFAHCICVYTCTYAREGANQMHKRHAGGQSERSEPISKMCMEMVRKNFLRISWKINTTCTRWYRCQTIWNRNNKKPQN